MNRRKIEYCLTPKGFEEKARLNLKLIYATTQQYLELKKIISQRFLEIQDAGVKRIVFYGVIDEMEVAYITIQGTDLKLSLAMNWNP